MIAMQYSFALPADYDMAIVDRRIAEKGHLLDNFPKLRFKAYLTARAGSEDTPGRENLYAPFYLWDHDEGLSDFLCGEVFTGVSRAFGWPNVKTWVVWQARLSDGIGKATFATRETTAIPPFAALGAIREREMAQTLEDVETGGMLASVTGFEPTAWTVVRFRLWDKPPVAREGVQIYRVGHLSLPCHGQANDKTG